MNTLNSPATPMRQHDAVPAAAVPANASSDIALNAASYVPPDPTQIDVSAVALAFWSQTLGVETDRLREAVTRVGPELETVKQELGVGGVG